MELSAGFISSAPPPALVLYGLQFLGFEEKRAENMFWSKRSPHSLRGEEQNMSAKSALSWKEEDRRT